MLGNEVKSTVLILMMATMLSGPAAAARLGASGRETTGVVDARCCYADKTETWLAGPDGIRWEWYVKTGDNEQFRNVAVGADDGVCCA